MSFRTARILCGNRDSTRETMMNGMDWGVIPVYPTFVRRFDASSSVICYNLFHYSSCLEFYIWPPFLRPAMVVFRHLLGSVTEAWVYISVFGFILQGMAILCLCLSLSRVNDAALFIFFHFCRLQVKACVVWVSFRFSVTFTCSV